MVSNQLQIVSNQSLPTLAETSVSFFLSKVKLHWPLVANLPYYTTKG